MKGVRTLIKIRIHTTHFWNMGKWTQSKKWNKVTNFQMEEILHYTSCICKYLLYFVFTSICNFFSCYLHRYFDRCTTTNWNFLFQKMCTVDLQIWTWNSNSAKIFFYLHFRHCSDHNLVCWTYHFNSSWIFFYLRL